MKFQPLFLKFSQEEGNTCPKILKKIVVYKKIRIKTLLTDEEKTREEKKERGGKRNERQDKKDKRKEG